MRGTSRSPYSISTTPQPRFQSGISSFSSDIALSRMARSENFRDEVGRAMATFGIISGGNGDGAGGENTPARGARADGDGGRVGKRETASFAAGRPRRSKNDRGIR